MVDMYNISYCIIVKLVSQGIDYIFSQTTIVTAEIILRIHMHGDSMCRPLFIN